MPIQFPEGSPQRHYRFRRGYCQVTPIRKVDDYVANGGSAGFEAPAAIRADQVVINTVQMPCLKFPRNPTQ